VSQYEGSMLLMTYSKHPRSEDFLIGKLHRQNKLSLQSLLFSPVIQRTIKGSLLNFDIL
jgi:hypothetical protein